VLHLRYRPQSLDAVVGQDITVRILKNALLYNKVASAFLFAGSRGLGKTSMARILAKAVNCRHRVGYNPCNNCADCCSITSCDHVDVLELDAASRTGVDDMRVIIEGAHYVPSVALYKIFIIDEAHMLSGSAFNALLKTLEEPPPRVKFILATTERRKIPDTIVSRCQNFNLARATTDLLVQHLRSVLTAENLTAEEGALVVMAQAASGSVRDALSILDQAATLCAGNNIDPLQNLPIGVITETAVCAMLGMPETSVTAKLLEFIMQRDCHQVVALVEQLYRDGRSMAALFNQLLALINSMLLEGPVAQLARIWDLALKAIDDIARAPNELWAARVAVVRMALLSDVGLLGGSAPVVSTGSVLTRSEDNAPKPAQTRQEHGNAAGARVGGLEPCFAHLRELIARADEEREGIVAHHLRCSVAIDSILNDEIEVTPMAESHLAKLLQLLSLWTSRRRSARILDGEVVTYGALLAVERAGIKSDLLRDSTASDLVEAFDLSDGDVDLLG
jgi:DNA polymerase-3 subunit gamma/tau